MQSAPLVSILINNYNYGRFLDDAVTSALSQTYTNKEVVVVDDGSTDDSALVLQKYADSVRIIHKANGGQASAFNAGFNNSRGEIVCFLDADDMYARDKLERIVANFARYPESEWCFDKVLHTDERMNPLADVVCSNKAYYLDCRREMRRGTLRKYLPMQIPATSGLSFKRGLLEKFFPIPESESCSMCENYMKYIAVGTSKGIILDAQLTLQRLHGSNLFTHTVKDPSMTVRISILTGYWLYRNYPDLARFADTQVALGMSLIRKARNLDPMYLDYVDEYLRLRGSHAALLIRSRAALYGLRSRLAPH